MDDLYSIRPFHINENHLLKPYWTNVDLINLLFVILIIIRLNLLRATWQHPIIRQRWSSGVSRDSDWIQNSDHPESKESVTILSVLTRWAKIPGWLRLSSWAEHRRGDGTEFAFLVLHCDERLRGTRRILHMTAAKLTLAQAPSLTSSSVTVVPLQSTIFSTTASYSLESPTNSLAQKHRQTPCRVFLLG